MVMMLGLGKVVLEIDSLTVASTLKMKTNRMSYLNAFYCLAIACKFDSVLSHFPRRSCNKAAHEVPKLVFEYQETRVSMGGKFRYYFICD